MTGQNKKNKSGVKIVQAKPAVNAPAIDELVADKKSDEERFFEELTQHADAVDRVLMEKGEPEYDLTSG